VSGEGVLSGDAWLTIVGAVCTDRLLPRLWKICLMMHEAFCRDCIRYAEVVSRVDGQSTRRFELTGLLARLCGRLHACSSVLSGTCAYDLSWLAKPFLVSLVRHWSRWSVLCTC
jgi:hypothetical protein